MDEPAEAVMTQKPLTVTPDKSLTRVLQLMAETRYKSLPVTIGALLIGIVAREDVLRALQRAAAGKRPRRVEVEAPRPGEAAPEAEGGRTSAWPRGAPVG
jgi:predicted transcriptional regulator